MMKTIDVNGNGLKMNGTNEAQRVALAARQAMAKALPLLDKAMGKNTSAVISAKQLARYIASGAIEVTDVISANTLALRVPYDSMTLASYASLAASLGLQILEWRSHSVHVLVCNNAMKPLSAAMQSAVDRSLTGRGANELAEC